jgi:glucose-6-phosphate 1-epimerase
MNDNQIVKLEELVPGYPVLRVKHPTCSAQVALHGAHVMSWCPAGEEEVLYLSPDAVYREGKAIRGGIPLCWPWFNAHPSDPDLPSHGLVRNQFWELESTDVDDDGVVARLRQTTENWTAVVTIRMGSVLEVSLESTNLADETMMVSGALHSYFRVGDVRKVTIKGLEDAEYLDTVGEHAIRQQTGVIRIDREVDQHYMSDGSVRLEDPVKKRTILIEKEGSPSTIVWNPWTEKAAALGDLPNEDYLAFVCIEAAITNDRAAAVGKGETHRFATRILIE